MRILFLAPKYLDLYKPIKDEMERQSHEVFFLEDQLLKTDSYLRQSNFLYNVLKSKYNKYFKVFEHYTNYLFDKYTYLNQPFDVFLCISGYSVSEYFIKRLKSINPNIYTVLYLWDTNRFYDFFKKLPYFDKSYSFDFEDCKNDKRLEFLPFYWQGGSNVENNYDISCIGSDHDERFRIIEKLLPQIKNASLSYFIRIKPVGIPNGLNYIKRLLLHPKELRQQIKDKKDCSNSEIALQEIMSPKDVEEVICKSRIILDTDRDSQHGTTPRVIWALAHKKKIISTNNTLKELPFYKPNQILIINKNNPVLDMNFFLSDNEFDVDPLIESLRIDRWVRKILNSNN